MRVLIACLLVSGCSRLDEQACTALRAEAFDRLHGSHACRDDADCFLSEWPGCPKPINQRARAQIADLRARFEKGGCREEPTTCPAAAEAYCDRQLCIFHYRRGP